MKKIYPSAVDWWLAALVLAVPLVLVGAGLSRLETAPRTAVLLFVQSGFVTVLMGAFTIPCRYTLTDDELEVRCGLIETKIPLVEITDAKLSRNVLSSPALSLKRVKILHGDRYALVSPRDREAFIADLLAAVERKRSGGTSAG